MIKELVSPRKIKRSSFIPISNQKIKAVSNSIQAEMDLVSTLASRFVWQLEELWKLVLSPWWAVISVSQ